MCGIAGYVSFGEDFRKHRLLHATQVAKMGETLVHRGPDDFDFYVGKHVAFSHTRLAVMDPERGKQPMCKRIAGYDHVLVYNGEVYNADELREELKKKGYLFETTSDTEVVLTCYIHYNEKMVEYLNGIYSFVIWNERENTIFFCRDRLGVKPLFYTLCDSCLVFGSEIKALLQYPGVEPVVAKDGWQSIFGIGPARIEGCGIYKNIYEILPGHCGTYSASGFVQKPYWQLEAKEVTDTYEQAVEKVKYLLEDSIIRQLASDVPICTLLSGGLDSSVVSAVAARYLKDKGRVLDTYSFDYTDNNKNFKASNFQPEEDRPYVEKMVEHIGSSHTYLECAYEELYDALYEAVDAKDMPGMTDVDASMLYFSKKIKEKHTVCLSGECADETFGGYPWFRAEESFSVNRFPWSRDLAFRKSVLNNEWDEYLGLEEYVQTQYKKSVLATSLLPGEQVDQELLFSLNEKQRKELPEEVRKSLYGRRERELAYLNVHWFMETLLERKDRMTMAAGLEVRVPFADHRLVEYLYTLPWEYKYHNKTVKSLLKDAMKEYLPQEVIERKKCPYPKTYDPKFENRLKKELARVLATTNAPINQMIDRSYMERLMKQSSDYGKPWFGQLMALPQMYAYLLQINYWMEKYKIRVE